MGQMNKGDILAVGLMMFSIFFGAGNLIFPPALGQAAGNHALIAMVGFVVTGVGLPLMGITETGTGWADRAAALPYGPGATTRRMVVSGWDRRVAEVTVDRSHMHPDLLRALDTTPPHKRVTIRDRVRAEATA